MYLQVRMHTEWIRLRQMPQQKRAWSSYAYSRQPRFANDERFSDSPAAILECVNEMREITRKSKSAKEFGGNILHNGCEILFPRGGWRGCRRLITRHPQKIPRPRQGPPQSPCGRPSRRFRTMWRTATPPLSQVRFQPPVHEQSDYIKQPSCDGGNHVEEYRRIFC